RVTPATRSARAWREAISGFAEMTTPLVRLVRTHKAIAHPVRLRLLAMLRSGPLCVCQMTVVVGLAASTVSEHLAELREAGLVLERRVARWVEYRLSPCAIQSLETFCAALDDDGEVHADAVRVIELRKVPLDERLQAGAAR
ncbi:MAG: ArsR/SmtB family transcription factor, partial [Thermoanaerobaculia bacterium]